MQKEIADKLVDELLEVGLTVKMVIVPGGDTNMFGHSGPYANVSFGSITLRHDQIMKAAEVAEKHKCELSISSFGQPGDISIITREEAQNMFPAHHKPPIVPTDGAR